MREGINKMGNKGIQIIKTEPKEKQTSLEQIEVNKLFLVGLKDRLPKVLKLVKAIEDLEQEHFTKELRELLIALTKFHRVVTKEKTRQQEINNTLLIKNKSLGLPYQAYLELL